MSIITACGIFMIGVIMQVASVNVGLLVAGRIVAGFGSLALSGIESVGC
jgi:hypothetical protein